MIWRIAFRNLGKHRLRTAIVGVLILLATWLVVVGYAILDAVDDGMQKSIVHSVTGHLQVYSDQAVDELAIFGRPGLVEEDYGRIDDFARVKRELEGVPNVAAVVPMGTGNSIIFGGNALDRKLAELRTAVREGDRELIDGLVEQVRRMVGILRDDLANLNQVGTEAVPAEAVALAEAAGKPEYWRGFGDDPYPTLERLENKLAPFALKGDLFFFRYLGTDPAAFAKNFKLFETVLGEMIPAGKRGFLFNHGFYERQVKDRIAVRLDRLKEARNDQGRRIAEDDELREWVRKLGLQASSLLYTMNPKRQGDVMAALQAELGTTESDPAKLVLDFLTLDDANFDRRYAFFYAQVAPHYELYKYPVGSEITLTSYTRSGYPRSITLTVYGTFQFESLEKSQLASAFQVVDLVTFRDLYGLATEEHKRELAELAKEAGVAPVARDDVEALFGEPTEVGADGAAEHFDETQDVDLAAARREAHAAMERGYTQQELEHGMVLTAAVLLEHPDDLDATIAAIQARSDAAGLGLRVSPWHEASGIVGQFTTAIYLVLTVLIVIVFAVALVIINNAMVMATMERVREIGTMRAIGAQRSVVMELFFTESLLLGILFGGAGIILGAITVWILGAVGIAATGDVLFFLFGGPVLRPTLLVGHLVLAFAVVSLVALLSTFFPAFIATRIQPVQAMEAAT
jgi:ABC-type lipoprotein release transport system permease subunit